MTHCLYCQEFINRDVTWSTLFLPQDPTPLCGECKQQLTFINEPFCNRCGRQQNEQVICHDCQYWLSQPAFETVLHYNRSLYAYTDFMQQIISQWKYRGDYQLKEIFSQPIKKNLRLLFPLKELVIIPIPLTEERQWDRAFNQSEAIARIIHDHFQLPICHVLKRKPSHTEKQSKKTRQQRINSENPFFLTKSLQKHVLLVDDIYTTGMTIHHAAALLKEAGCASIYSFTLIR